MSDLGIVVIGYNRVESIKRLLNSLSCVNYMGDSIDLIISIDNSGTNSVEEFAKHFTWNFGNKIIKTYPQRLGLRKHVLTCGDYVSDYDAIAVFEDDIWVSPSFYSYMKQSVEFYKNETNVAGISLYNHLWSEYNRRPFVPEKSKYDAYFLQYAQSWGQIWLKKQWFEFREWYESNKGPIISDINTPDNLLEWPETSWLKYHIKYCIDQKKYFVYPYVSFTTNFVEIGQHCKTSNTVYQVPMEYHVDSSRKFKFPIFGKDETSYYDAFFERMFLAKYLNCNDNELIVDIYGNKKIDFSKKYAISSKRLDYKIVQSFALNLRPQEANVEYNIKGEDIFLYDLTIPQKNKFSSDFDLARWYYDSRVFDYNYLVKVLLKIIMKKFKEKLKK